MLSDEKIEARALELFPVREKENKKATGTYDSNLQRRKAYIQGCKDFRDELLANAATIVSEVVETQEEVTCRPYLALENLCYIPAPKFCEEGDKVMVIMIKENV